MDDRVNLIYEALCELGHKQCPECECFIGLEKYITRQDIEDWLKKRKTFSFAAVNMDDYWKHAMSGAEGHGHDGSED